ncbi:unnamed protein product [Thelazia callipaeda]|uniref:Protein kinase domain-containing protein n=1 Tax=Thelazia callipaeda TaxID=103827 RepID=A0A0N5CK41_THECL|nr:unnamed protein product [Thelazia callipaeda]
MHIFWISFLVLQTLLLCNLFNGCALGSKICNASSIHLITSEKWNQPMRIRYPADGAVYGVTIHKQLLATVLDNTIIVWNISSIMTLKDFHCMQLPEPVQKKLLEFKFIDDEMLLYCDVTACRLCVLTSLNEPCIDYHLALNNKKVEKLMYAVAAKDSNENVIIRFSTQNTNKAAILKFQSHHFIGNFHKISSVQSAEDIHIIDRHKLATAFNRQGYTYFVGSARRPYEPYINAKMEETIVMSVIITRVCDGDHTHQLESRIDMALVCGNISSQTNVRTLAAEYNPQSDSLIVVFQALETDYNLACKYSMDHVNNAFDQIWMGCQNITYKSSTKECQKIQNEKELPAHCFIFSRRADAHAMRTCSRFGGRYSKEPLNNCDLELFPSSAYRYGWLEQFYGLKGQLIAIFPNFEEDILSVKHFHDDNALFIVHTGGYLQRISIQKNHTASSSLWALQLQRKQPIRHMHSFRYQITADFDRNRIYYVQDNELSYTELTCSYFYDTCDSLERLDWSDPLHCRWCAMKNGSGYAFSAEKGDDTCPFYVVDSLCTPFIEHVNIPSTLTNQTVFEVYGGRFDRLQDIEAKVCNQYCAVLVLGSTKLSCTVDMTNNAARDCNFHLNGKLGALGPFTVIFELPQKLHFHIANTVLANTANHYSKRSRAVAAICAVIVLASLIVLILHVTRRLYEHKRIRMKHYGKNRSSTEVDENHAAFVDSSLFRGLRRNDDQIKNFNPYENLFLEIDSKLKIPLKDLEFGDEIGKGNFGIVYRAVYRKASNGQLMDVACKTIDSHSDGVITGVSEFLREGLIMANLNHLNVARLVGISATDNSYPIIVTEFMAQGDLRHYIINPENKLTFGNLLDFGIQIARGMTYLHEKQFIHRDLAARNCMLDANLTVKIADFGLSRDVSRCGMYQTIHRDRGIPIRWMPIESLEKQLYTFKADIWAYGVVLWELATRGLVPYANLEFTDILRLLKIGHRLTKPKGCPDNLYYHVMRPCWTEDPQCRPTFCELTEMMEDVVRQLRRGISGGALLDSHYERVSVRSFATSPTVTNNLDSTSDPVITDLKAVPTTPNSAK